MPQFKELLRQSNYDTKETEFLLEGFTRGFDIGYRGTPNRQSYAENIPITVGSTQELWDKVMKEVRAGRYAGPYKKIPYKNFIQSPIGLVPKAGNKTRLIFHLSFEFLNDKGENIGSVNSCTPKEWCSVKYNDIDAAVAECLKVFKYAKDKGVIEPMVYLGKTDLSSAFRVLPLWSKCICWLMMKACDPETGKTFFFVEKCLPFGASISCSHYQRFSNALKHIIKWRYEGLGRELTNYLDDFLFLAYTKLLCDGMIQGFIDLCQEINVPVAIEKTEWSDVLMVFLGILLDGKNLVLSIPIEK